MCPPPPRLNRVNFVPPNNLVYVFLFYFADEQGEEIVMERENGGEIYAKDSMKLEGVRLKSISVL